MRRSSAAVTDLLSRAVVAMLFTLLVINILGDFLRTGRITGLLLLVGESLVVVLTVIPRRADSRPFRSGTGRRRGRQAIARAQFRARPGQSWGRRAWTLHARPAPHL